jgi:mannose-6-phosphate isomerase-like protein (cupin superfamily)
VFIVIEGTMQIEFEDRTIELNEGEMLVVPKGVRHKPYAEAECKVMLVEPRGVVNTSDTGDELTADNDVWV